MVVSCSRKIRPVESLFVPLLPALTMCGEDVRCQGDYDIYIGYIHMDVENDIRRKMEQSEISQGIFTDKTISW